MKTTFIAMAAALALGVAGSNRARAAEETGTIKGTVDRPGDLTTIFAIERFSKKSYRGNVNPKTGDFTVSGLPLDANYDLVIDCGAARLEGVNVKVPSSDYEEEQPLAKEDIAKLKEIIGDLNQFEDTVDIMQITGNIQHAAVVLNKRRTKPFYGSKPGEIIWRLEVWRFEKPEETWVKRQDELFVIHYRERMDKSVYEKKAITLDPQLGGLKPTAKELVIKVGKVELPGKGVGIKIRPVKAPVAPKVEKKED